MTNPYDPPMHAAREAVLRHLPGLGVFLIVIQEDGTISTTSNVLKGRRIELLQQVLAREIERAGLSTEPPGIAN